MKHSLLLIMAILAVADSNAVSFDCDRASFNVERLICGDQTLGSLDDLMAETYSMQPEGEVSPDLRKQQRSWLQARNACMDSSCIRQQYEQRLAKLWCDGDHKMGGSAIAATRCSYFSMKSLEPKLESLENQYVKKVSSESGNPEYTKATFEKEKIAWRAYRGASCAHYGALEGGSDGWKNAFASMCELDETKKRIQRFSNEIEVK